jgi:hypothetical protein
MIYKKIYKLSNIRYRLQHKRNPIVKSRVYGQNNKNQYKLIEDVYVELSNREAICIPSGYIWDLASVPRIFQFIITTDNDAEIAFLIHDFLYENKIGSRKFADNEMKIWQKETNGTENYSLRNADNLIRYYVVRAFGWIVYYKK